MNWRTLLLFVAIQTYGWLFVYGSQCLLHKIQEGYRALGVSESLKATSVLGCVRMCHMSFGCTSLNYIHGTGQCELLEKGDVQMNLDASSIFVGGYTVVEVRSLEAIVTCPDNIIPPEVANTEYSVNDQRSLVTYTCRDPYVQTGGNATVACMYTKESSEFYWNTPTIHCKVSCLGVAVPQVSHTTYVMDEFQSSVTYHCTGSYFGRSVTINCTVHAESDTPIWPIPDMMCIAITDNDQ